MKRAALKRILPVLFWLLIWQLLSMYIGRDILLTGPVRVLLRLLVLIKTPAFWRAVLFSLGRIAAGFALAMLTGAVLAGLSARFSMLEALLSPLVFCMKTVPVASFIILALIWFSSKNLSVLISFLMGFPVLYTNTLQGIRGRNREMQELARVYDIPLMRRLRCIDLPEIYPFFQAGCRIALGLCWKAGIAAEVIGMPRGSIGERLQQAKVYLDTPDLFAWTAVIVAVSLGFEHAVLWLLGKADERAERIKK